MERLLGAAKELSEKVDSNETAAGDLLRQCETLQEELKAMKQVSLKTKLSHTLIIYKAEKAAVFVLGNSSLEMCPQRVQITKFASILCCLM